MTQPNDNETLMPPEQRGREFDRLREEITMLRIEGLLYCFDKHEAKRRSGVITSTLKDADGLERPVSIDINPRYGQPSTIAYKVAQAIFLKMTEAGEPYSGVVMFTQRELARLVDRKWSGVTSQQLYTAMMQLKRTGISCAIHNKDTKETLQLEFEFLASALFSSKEKAITECVVQVHDFIVASLNRHHAVWLNYQRLAALDPIAAVLYKRLFYHFSNTYTPRRARSTLKFEKDYEDICREWLGGLKPEKYKSRIEKQLGRYLADVHATGIISSFEIAERTKGVGFKLVFHPGDAFFADYERFYLRAQDATASKRVARETLNPQPLQLVSYFHKLLGHEGDTFTEKETAQASDLLRRYSEPEVRSLIDYAVERFKETRFNPSFFGAILTHQPSWSTHLTERQEAAARQAAKANCPICKGEGWLMVDDGKGQRARICTHGQTETGSPSATQ